MPVPISFCVTITVQDLSRRFADGRLSTEKLLEANDDELAEMLIEVRGIGRVSFSLSHVSCPTQRVFRCKVDRYVKIVTQVDSALIGMSS